MIQVYLDVNKDYDRNGDAVLCPESCTVTEEAGANYELAMVHPIDEHGLWRYLQPGYIIKAPVPAATTEVVWSKDTIDIYSVRKQTEVRAKPKGPVRKTYAAWYPCHDESTGAVTHSYEPGARVTYSGNNYQCILGPLGSDADFPPSDMKSYWKRIDNYTGGAAVLTKLGPGDIVYFLQSVDSTWMRIVTQKSIEGYVLKSACEFLRTEEFKPVEARNVRDQLFRIYSVTVNTKTHKVNVSARHVSYDLSGILVGPCSLTNQSPTLALSLIRTSMFADWDNIITTNLSEDEDGKYSGDNSYKNVISVLLDPDDGFVPFYKARLYRDNWDIFIYRNETRDRKLRLVYGENLIGVTWTRNSGKLINRVMPVAKTSAGKDLFLDDTFVESELLTSYPIQRMERMEVDGKIGGSNGDGGTWTEATLKRRMLELALRRFSVDHCDEPTVEIKVEFQLLGETKEYEQYKDLQKLFLYDTITVCDPTVDLEQKLQVSKTVWDAINSRYTGITLGDVFNYDARSVAGYELRNGAIQFRKLSVDAINKIKG